MHLGSNIYLQTTWFQGEVISGTMDLFALPKSLVPLSKNWGLELDQHQFCCLATFLYPVLLCHVSHFPDSAVKMDKNCMGYTMIPWYSPVGNEVYHDPSLGWRPRTPSWWMRYIQNSWSDSTAPWEPWGKGSGTSVKHHGRCTIPMCWW